MEAIKNIVPDFLRTIPEIRAAASPLNNGRDEMNLVEHPFATLADRAPRGVNVLEYDVEDFDRQLKRPIRRKITVVGDAKHGLPTAKDEEVYLGLLQWTKLYNEFSSPLVQFCRAQLFDLMSWPKKDSSYRRLLLAMDRLTGTKITYFNAWRDNANKQWVDRERIAILESYKFRDSRKGVFGVGEERLSQFRWGADLFASFQNGYLKKLDYELVKGLSPLGRRLYRFLDKHFHPPHRMRLEYELRLLACEHLGVSRGADNTQIRDRYLKPAIDELEVVGFLRRRSAAQRFMQVSRGRWVVTLESGSTSSTRQAIRMRRGGMSEPVRPERRLITGKEFC